ncbi:MAG: Monogalactosyldiacylglycerol synthase [Ignavibacteriae bacterium]|nr:MAG: Monogalactosyldiacylglycerol synthase [Ignavibacteriota bacterium]
MSKKYYVLIISCTGGSGHIRAAEALHKTAQLLNLPIQTEHYNILDFTPKFFKNLYAKTYINLVRLTPNFWGYFYDKLELKNYSKNHLIKFFDKINYKKYLQTIIKLKPDAIICTHFLPYVSISEELRKEKFNVPIFAATTDFDIHTMWIDPIVEKYFVYHEESKKRLVFKGITENKISITGIPILPEFNKNLNKKSIRKKLSLEPDNFTILVLSGGFGVGKISNIVKHINNQLQKIERRKFNLLVVCGKNKKLMNKISKMDYPFNVKAKIFSFVENIHDLMDASNILISKSGGLTSSEAMAKGLPMLIIDPIPGQEVQNANLITQAGAGWKAINVKDLCYRLNQVIEKPEILKYAVRATKNLARGDAAENILKEVVWYLKKSK